MSNLSLYDAPRATRVTHDARPAVTAWAFAHSPYRGAGFRIHLALADSVDTAPDGEFCVSQEWIAGKARCTRQTVNDTLNAMVADGMLLLVEDNAAVRKPNRYRFLMPTNVPVMWNPAVVGGADRARAKQRTPNHNHIHSLADRDGWLCTYCGIELSCACNTTGAKPTAVSDHVLPRSRGGSDDDDNRVLACWRCNSSKRDQTPSEWEGPRWGPLYEARGGAL